MADDSLTRSLQERRLYLEVGVRLRRRREGRRMTQDELASAVGLSRSSVANIERGQQRAPVHVLLWLAEALRVDVGTLLPTHDELVALTAAGWDVKKQVSIGGESSGLPPDVVQFVGALLTRPSGPRAQSRERQGRKYGRLGHRQAVLDSTTSEATDGTAHAAKLVGPPARRKKPTEGD